MDNMRDPDVPIRLLVNPPAIVSQFSFVVLELRWKIISTHRTGMEVIPLFIPSRKTVIQTSIESNRIRSEISIGHNEFLLSFHKKRAFFSRSFDRSFIDEKLRFFVFTHTEPVQSFLQHVE
jgi:hypothetical protein